MTADAKGELAPAARVPDVILIGASDNDGPQDQTNYQVESVCLHFQF